MLKLAMWVLALEVALAVWLLRLPDVAVWPNGQAVAPAQAERSERL